jgi:hypothetical protein
VVEQEIRRVAFDPVACGDLDRDPRVEARVREDVEQEAVLVVLRVDPETDVSHRGDIPGRHPCPVLMEQRDLRHPLPLPRVAVDHTPFSSAAMIARASLSHAGALGVASPRLAHPLGVLLSRHGRNPLGSDREDREPHAANEDVPRVHRTPRLAGAVALYAFLVLPAGAVAAAAQAEEASRVVVERQPPYVILENSYRVGSCGTRYVMHP